MIPIALCGIAIDPIYKNFILQGENYGDANFIQGNWNLYDRNLPQSNDRHLPTSKLTEFVEEVMDTVFRHSSEKYFVKFLLGLA